MTKAEELNLFLVRADEFIESKYIIADVKIVNLLKAIASSKTLVAIFENCLKDFDYLGAKRKYLAKNDDTSADKGQFIMPPNSRELLALVFGILMEIDGRTLNLNEFINKYFYVDGSLSSAYSKFTNEMVKPFKNSVKLLMESVIEGKIQDPIEALIEAENESAKKKAEKEKEEITKKELAKKTYGESIEKIRQILLADKTNVKKMSNPDKKEEITLVIDMFANAILSEDKDAIVYAYVAYKYMAKAHPFKFFGRIRKIKKLLTDIFDAI